MTDYIFSIKLSIWCLAQYLCGKECEKRALMAEMANIPHSLTLHCNFGVEKNDQLRISAYWDWITDRLRQIETLQWRDMEVV
jgi:hypothetical protein